MTDHLSNRFDVLVLGSGFAGTLMALILHRQGYQVGVLEKGSHPRFAIGESSTPIADMILRNLSQQYDLPWLHSFSRYGTWQREHPEVGCGLKRGFSFFKHHRGKDFTTDNSHRNELFVAASTNDELSDTNWFRADFDHFLVKKLLESGIPYADEIQLNSLQRISGRWQLDGMQAGRNSRWETDYLVDATGSGRLAETFLGTESINHHFQTNTCAVYSHFLDIPRWNEVLSELNIQKKDYPFSPDDSALHHLLDEGWLWSLRFNDRPTSLGLVLGAANGSDAASDPYATWNNILCQYPSLYNPIIAKAQPAPIPGKLLASGRLQRQLSRGCGEGWAALPHTIGFIDPLFSTGIAHSLSGVERLATLFSGTMFSGEFDDGIREYEQSVLAELAWMDQLIAGCYRTMHHIEGFNAWSMLFFTATIAYEQARLRQRECGLFLKADEKELRRVVNEAELALGKILSARSVTKYEWQSFTEMIRQMIRPWNTAGLLDPEYRNMYPHAAIDL